MIEVPAGLATRVGVITIENEYLRAEVQAQAVRIAELEAQLTAALAVFDEEPSGDCVG